MPTTCSKGNDRAVTVFKQKGSSKHANDVFALSFQQESVDMLNAHFQVELLLAAGHLHSQ